MDGGGIVIIQNKIYMKQILACCILLMAIHACTTPSGKESGKKAEYENAKETLAEREMKNPVDFLVVTARDKRNLIGQTVVKGMLSNKAKVTTYYDILLERSFFSKTGALLEKDQETFYERLAPGAEVDFKSKLFAPKGSDSVHLKVLQAKSEKQ